MVDIIHCVFSTGIRKDDYTSVLSSYSYDVDTLFITRQFLHGPVCEEHEKPAHVTDANLRAWAVSLLNVDHPDGWDLGLGIKSKL